MTSSGSYVTLFQPNIKFVKTILIQHQNDHCKKTRYCYFSF